MRITKRQLRRIILQETKRLFEDTVDTELDHLKKNIGDDIEHIRDLKDDIKDDHEEELHAEKEKERKDESRRKMKKQLRNIVRRVMKEEHQGYDAREDEHLAALHGAAADHDQDYHDRRDDAGFEDRDDATHHVHHHHHHHDDQGYDAREDERLAAEHGAEAAHDQDYKDRRDDAGFEVRHESKQRQALKRKLARKIRETLRRKR
jgi:hypothetical protein